VDLVGGCQQNRDPVGAWQACGVLAQWIGGVAGPHEAGAWKGLGWGKPSSAVGWLCRPIGCMLGGLAALLVNRGMKTPSTS
jgi:hypothetical protein